MHNINISYCDIIGKWNLSVVRWWGSWCKNKSVEVILKYLLEEVESAENDFSDMFSPDRDNSIRTDFIGDSNKPTTSFIS